MNSSIFIVPIVVVAVYSIYRLMRKEIADGGSGTCRDCPSRGKCGMPGSANNFHIHDAK